MCITSADLLFRSFQARAGLGDGDPATVAELFPHGVPIVTLLDGHPHTLAFLGTTALTSQTVNVTGSVFRFAAPSAHTPEPVTLGNRHVGDAAPSQALTAATTTWQRWFPRSLRCT